MTGLDTLISNLQLAYWTVLIASGPVLAIALAVGLLIGILQAATSINEATISFVPKLAIVLVAMAVMAGAMFSGLSDFFHHVFDEIAVLR